MNFDRFEKRRKEKGLSASFLCVQAGKSNHYVADCKKTGKVPPAVLAKWAELLDVSVDWLTDKTDDPTRTQKGLSTEPGSITDSQYQEIIRLWASLPLDKQQEAENYLRYLIAQRER